MSASGMVERLRDIESHLVIEESSIGLTLYEFEAGHLNKIVFSNRESIYLNDFLFLQSDESELPRFESLSNLYDLYILCADSIGICFGKSSPYVSKTSITLKELRSIPLACFQSSEETRSLLFSVLCRFGSRDLPDPVHVSNSRRVCIDYVVRDTNIGFLCIIPDEISWELDSRHFEDRAIVPLKEKIKIYTIMACKKDSLLSPAASLFKKATLKHFEKTCYRFAQ